MVTPIPLYSEVLVATDFDATCQRRTVGELLLLNLTQVGPKTTAIDATTATATKAGKFSQLRLAPPTVKKFYWAISFCSLRSMNE